VADWESFKPNHISQIGDRAYAYTQVGGWGFNNMALIVSDGETLLIDTTSDIPMTRRMLDAFAAADPAAATIDVLALTHWHVDHVHGACMPNFRETRIICTETVEDYMANLPPKAWLGQIESLTGDAKKAMDRNLQDFFDFSGLEPIVPTESFNGRTEFTFGRQRVQLIEAGPCHTASDTVVYLPDAGVVHFGDITGAGTYQGLQYPGLGNVIAVLEEAVTWEAQAYVAGHGPVMDLADVRDQLDSCHWLMGEAKKRHEKGMEAEDAADDLLRSLDRTTLRRNPQGLYGTIQMIFNELDGRLNYHIRKNYPKYLANSYRLSQEFPKRHPDLAGGAAHAAPAAARS
jgi:glyoxylase-like metal-dependent hydrolase (beta-lactamase superfamily II)